jgi:hypothetical protein
LQVAEAREESATRVCGFNMWLSLPVRGLTFELAARRV